MKTTVIETFKGFDISAYKLPMITVYKSPTDFPGLFVARIFDLSAPQMFAVVKESLEEVRDLLPEYMIRMQRHEEDDPNIIEVWL